MAITRNDLTIYDAVADQWWSGGGWLKALHSMVPGRLSHFDRLAEWQDSDVLDLGCAGGFMAEAIAKRGARVTGIDPAEKAVGAARAHAAAEGLDIRYDVGVGEALPYEDDSFDYVVSVDVFEHVADLDKVLAEIARVLRPGGLLLFDTINRNPLAGFVVVFMAERVIRLLPRGTHDPEMFIRPSEMRAKMTAAGLKPGAFTGLGPRGVRLSGELIFGRLPLTAIIYMGHAEQLAD